MNASHQQQLVAAVLAARVESTTVDFKSAFDPASNGDWLEVLKDIAAFANSGGGMLLFGVDDDGKSTGLNCQAILDFDPARINDKLRKYTGTNVADLILSGYERDGQPIVGLYAGPVEVPLVFIADGQYTNSAGVERFAFRTGTTYFRHGAKSEPGTSNDLRQFLDRRIEGIRSSWLSGIRQVVEGPPGAEFRIVPSGSFEQASDNRKVRVVTNVEATPCITLDPDKTHFYRQSDVVRIANSRLIGRAQINPHDVLSVRRIHETDRRPEFFWKGKFSAAQYSDAFLDWLILSFDQDKQFFDKARAEYHKVMTNRNEQNRKGITS